MSLHFMRMGAVKFMFIQDLWLNFVHLTFKHGLSGAKTGAQMCVAKISDKIHFGHPTGKSVFRVSSRERLKLVCSTTETG